jgi:hypothetical protein
MYDDVCNYSQETILGHISICNKRFSEIKTPIYFVSTEYRKMLLGSIDAGLQTIGKNK